MLGLLLIYYIGKKFYILAEDFNKSKWGFAILGVVTYYAGTMIFGVALALIDESLLEMNSLLLSVISMPFGLLACWGLFMILFNSWSKSFVAPDESEVLDANLVNPEEQFGSNRL